MPAFNTCRTLTGPTSWRQIISEMTYAKPVLVGVAIFTACRYPHERNPSNFIPLLDCIHHAVICMA
jgi:hypothetical protein